MITLVLPAIFLITTIPNILNLRPYQTQYDTLDIKKEIMIHIKNSLQSKKLQKLTPTPTLTPSPTNVPTPTYTPTPTPRLIPHGKKGFSVSSGKKTGPQMSRGYIDPYDPNIGEGQKIGIRIKHNQPVSSVSLTMKTDHGVKVIPMHLISGTDTDGIWEGEWTTSDTYLYNYHAVLEAVSSNGSAIVDITLR